MDAKAIVKQLGMAQHPEGGWYVETYRDAPQDGGRGTATAIYFLLERGQRSHWHTVDAAEIWFWHAGAPLRLGISVDGQAVFEVLLGPALLDGQALQAVVPVDAWQSAESCGEWTLVSCVVAPAFEFRGFRMADPGWEPRQAQGSSSS